MTSVAVLGAGIAGLTAAHRLRDADVSVTVFEAASRAGGVIRSESSDGFLVEHGPNSIRAGSVELERLIDDLDLADERVWGNEVASTRYVVRDGTPTPLPHSIGSFATTDLFSASAKLRLLAEPFVGRGPAGQDESVADFTRRRLGSEILDYAVAPFVGGVFAGSPDALSVRHAFPKLASLEEQYGSLFLGAVRSAFDRSSSQSASTPSGLFSFVDGLSALPNALAAQLDDCIQYDTEITGLTHEGDGWRLDTSGAGPSDRRFDAVICTLPAHQLTALSFDTPVDLGPLNEVWYPPLSVLALGYPEDAVAHPLGGFGMLVPPVEDEIDILGTIFSSTLFPNRAPDGHVLLTTFVGGARHPDQAGLPTEKLTELVQRDLDALLGVEGEPSFQHRIFWERAIPQYEVGYNQVKDALTALEETHPGLVFAGNYVQGVSVPDALESGADAATRLVNTHVGAPG